MPTLCLFDASGYIHRAFHALPLLTTSKGEPVHAIYGFSRMISKVLKEDRPDYVAVCFDTAAPTFRHEAYREYKGTRTETDLGLVSQIPLVEELVEAWGLPAVRKDGFEADDVIATLAEQGRKEGCRVLILSGDKDVLQLVSESVFVRDEIRNADYTIEKVKERYGVDPSQLVDMFSIMGDKVDNVIGVPGVGPKTAGKLIADYGSLENLYREMNGTSPSLKEKLINYKECVFKNRDLVALRKDVGLGLTLGQLKVRKPDPQKLPALLRRLEFRGSLYGAEEFNLESAREINKKRKVHTILTQNELSLLQKQLSQAKRLAYDLETSGLNQHECDLVGVSLSWREDEAWYIPVGHRYIGAPEQLPWTLVRDVLKPVLENPAVLKCGHNLKFDNAILERFGVHPQGPFFDTMIAAYCIDPARTGYGLKDLAGELFNERMTRITELISDKADQSFALVPVEQAAPYAGADAEVVTRLAPVMQDWLVKENLENLFANLEMPLVQVIQRMEAAGVAVDTDYLKAVGRKFDKAKAELEKEIWALAGEEFVVNSPKQLGRILFEKLKLPVIKRTKTGYSTDEDVLSRLAESHAICNKIIQYRELAKLSSTYVETLLGLVSSSTGRVHTSFNQTGTITGRLSSSEPNLQNIPIRTELGREIRRAFVAEKGKILLSADYSQIDLRALAHISEDPILVKTFREGGDVHTATAAEVFHVSVEEVTSEMRQRAKAINFGIVYGQQAYGLSQSLKIPVNEAQQFIANYFERYAGVQQWIRATLEKARATGVVLTLAGRRRQVRDINSPSVSARGFAERVAINTPIQGSSADIIKAAMISVSKELEARRLQTKMLVQVHDELLFEIPEKEVDDALLLIKKGMEEAFSLRVPLVVDMKMGPNWMDMKKIPTRMAA